PRPGGRPRAGRPTAYITAEGTSGLITDGQTITATAFTSHPLVEPVCRDETPALVERVPEHRRRRHRLGLGVHGPHLEVAVRPARYEPPAEERQAAPAVGLPADDGHELRRGDVVPRIEFGKVR